MTNIQAIRMLRAGNQSPSKVTYSNARLIDDLYEPVTRYIGISSDELKTALVDFIKTNDEGFNEQNIISMFIPNTYEMYWNTSKEKFFEKYNEQKSKKEIVKHI